MTEPVDPIAFVAALPPGKRLFGLDLGTKTIGIAVSDERFLIATPLITLPRVKFGKDAAALIEQLGIAEDLCHQKADEKAADDAQLGLDELRNLCDVLLVQRTDDLERPEHAEAAVEGARRADAVDVRGGHDRREARVGFGWIAHIDRRIFGHFFVDVYRIEVLAPIVDKVQVVVH